MGIKIIDVIVHNICNDHLLISKNDWNKICHRLKEDGNTIKNIYDNNIATHECECDEKRILIENESVNKLTAELRKFRRSIDSTSQIFKTFARSIEKEK